MNTSKHTHTHTRARAHTHTHTHTHAHTFTHYSSNAEIHIDNNSTMAQEWQDNIETVINKAAAAAAGAAAAAAAAAAITHYCKTTLTGDNAPCEENDRRSPVSSLVLILRCLTSRG